MSQIIIYAVDDDFQVISALVRDLKTKYRKEYRILSTSDPKEALDSLPALINKGETVGLFISDQRMPAMEGVEFLEKTREFYPEAKKILLTAYSDTEAAIRAINTVGLDYYLMKPWDPPDEKLYPVIDDLLEQWRNDYIPDFNGIRIVGYPFSACSHELKDFLAGNLVPYEWLDITRSDKGRELLKLNEKSESNLPLVFFEDGTYLVQPNPQDLAARIGLNAKASADLYDVVVIGAGPSGLAASVYGSSEGLRTLLIEKHAPGGQAGTSSRIENYLGFPVGLSGADLTRRAVTQASRFGTEIMSPREVKDIRVKDNYKIICMGGSEEIICKSLVITTGVSYRQLDVPNICRFTGAGVYYGSAITEAQACSNKDVYIVGGGNSAGQAAMYLSKFACKVNIVIRRESLNDTMSSYLVSQIKTVDTIAVIPCTEVISTGGNQCLEMITLRNGDTGETRTVDCAGLFIFIGANPFTNWILPQVLRNDKGFLLTGREVQDRPEFTKVWTLKRDPWLLETSVPGIFAAGDVRAGAMNRVASAVGEGAMSISFVHRYLAEV